MHRNDAPSRHLSVHIDRPVEEVYDFAADPRNLPAWAHGLGSNITQVEGAWVADSPMGRVRVAFAPRNEFGVLDHDVTLPAGETVYNPVRVLRDGAGSEVVFTLRRRPEMSEAEFESDAETVATDLARLRKLCEAR